MEVSTPIFAAMFMVFIVFASELMVPSVGVEMCAEDLSGPYLECVNGPACAGDCISNGYKGGYCSGFKCKCLKPCDKLKMCEVTPKTANFECSHDDSCSDVCAYEGYTGGHCTKRSCRCWKPCDAYPAYIGAAEQPTTK